jgi:hypothetical protein
MRVSHLGHFGRSIGRSDGPDEWDCESYILVQISGNAYTELPPCFRVDTFKNEKKQEKKHVCTLLYLTKRGRLEKRGAGAEGRNGERSRWLLIRVVTPYGTKPQTASALSSAGVVLIRPRAAGSFSTPAVTLICDRCRLTMNAFDARCRRHYILARRLNRSARKATWPAMKVPRRARVFKTISPPVGFST